MKIWEDQLQFLTRFLSSRQFRRLSKVHGNRRILDSHQCKEFEMMHMMKFTYPIKTSSLMKSWIASCKRQTYQMYLAGKGTMATRTRYRETWEGENSRQCRWVLWALVHHSSLTVILRILELSPMDSTITNGRETISCIECQKDQFISHSSSLGQGWLWMAIIAVVKVSKW